MKPFTDAPTLPFFVIPQPDGMMINFMCRLYRIEQDIRQEAGAMTMRNKEWCGKFIAGLSG